jgi:hypothetical protein
MQAAAGQVVVHADEQPKPQQAPVVPEKTHFPAQLKRTVDFTSAYLKYFDVSSPGTSTRDAARHRRAPDAS